MTMTEVKKHSQTRREQFHVCKIVYYVLSQQLQISVAKIEKICRHHIFLVEYHAKCKQFIIWPFMLSAHAV